MKQGYRVTCMKSVVTGLLLLCLQLGSFAQEVDSTIDVTTLADTEQQQDTPQQVMQQEPRVFRNVPDSVISKLQQAKEFEYANDPAYWKKKKQAAEPRQDWISWLASKDWFRYMVLTLMAAVLLFALIKIAMSNKLFMFSGRKRSGNTEEDELLQKDNLDELVQQAETQEDFRLAIRYRYMKALQEMDEKNIISLNAQSTNWDYVNRLGAHPLKKQFLLLTRAYEYVWYGEFAVNKEQYGYLRTEFQQFENALSK